MTDHTAADIVEQRDGLLAWAGAASNEHQPCAYSGSEIRAGIRLLADEITRLRAREAEREDMANVGEALMETLDLNRGHSFLNQWHPADCPSEIVTDLLNALDEANAREADAAQTLDNVRKMCDHLEHVIDRDLYVVAAVAGQIKDAIRGRIWLLGDGRGSYEWDDERYKDEFGAAVEEIEQAAAPLAIVGWDKSDCTRIEERVEAARNAAKDLLAQPYRHREMIAADLNDYRTQIAALQRKLDEAARLLKGWDQWHRRAGLSADDDCEYLNSRGWDDAEALASSGMGLLASIRGEA